MIQSGVGGSLCIIQKPRRTLASVWLQSAMQKQRPCRGAGPHTFADPPPFPHLHPQRALPSQSPKEQNGKSFPGPSPV